MSDRAEVSLVWFVLKDARLLRDAAIRGVPPEAFSNHKLGIVWRALRAAHDSGAILSNGSGATHAVPLDVVVAEAEKQGLGGATFEVAAAIDSAADIEFAFSPITIARLVTKGWVERRLRSVYNSLAADPHDQALQKESDRLRLQLTNPDDQLRIEDYAYEGERWEFLDDRKPIEAIVPGLLYKGHLAVLGAKPFCGKTALALWLLRKLSMGIPFWEGVAAPTQERVLYISFDEDVGVINARLKGMDMVDTLSKTRALRIWRENFTLIGRDQDTPTAKLDTLRLPAGVGELDRIFREAAEQKRPYGVFVFDTLATSLEPGFHENENPDMTTVMTAVQNVCSRYDVAGLMLHHPSKRKTEGVGTEESDPFVEGLRGASAIAGSARAVAVMRRLDATPHQRILMTRSNLGPSPEEVYFQVCEPGDAGIVYWKQVAGLGDVDPDEYDVPFEGGEPMNLNMLGLRVEDSDAERATTTGKRRARQLIRDWTTRGLVRTEKGPRNATLIWRIRPVHGEAQQPEGGEDVPF